MDIGCGTGALLAEAAHINFASAHNDEVLQSLMREFGYHGYYLYFDKKPMLKNLAND
jgi:hypothetical protein